MTFSSHPLPVLLTSNDTDVGYLTGFLGGDSVLIAGPGKATIVSDTRYLEELEHFKPIAKIVMRSGAMSACSNRARCCTR